MGVTETLRLECLLTVPREGGAQLAVAEDPQSSLLGADRPSPMWRAPRLRVSPAGDVALLAADQSAVARFDAAGAPGGVTPLGGGAIVDFVAAADGTVVLLEQGNLLRRIGPDGDERWRRDALEGSFGGLLADGDGTAYLVTERPAAAVAAIGDDGALRPVAELGPPGAAPQMDTAGRLFTVGFDPATRRRSWNRLDPVSGERTVVPCDEAATAALALPVGVDRHGRAYAADGTALTCVDGGEIAWRFDPRGAVPLPDGAVVSAAQAGPGELELLDPRGGASVRVRLPGADRAWQLISATPDGSRVLWGADAIAVLDADGELRELQDPAPEDARLRGWSVAPAREWRVDAEGRVHLVVAGPERVAVLRAQ